MPSSTVSRPRPTFGWTTLFPRSPLAAPVANLFTAPAPVPPSGNSTVYYNGFWGTAKKVFADEGYAGFAKGLRARLMIHTPSMAISWTTYEVVKRFLAERY